MKPVKQTLFTKESEGIYGNCFAACLASLLEIPITAVPELSAGDHTDDTGQWVRRTNAWLATLGLAYLEYGSMSPLDYDHLGIATYHVIIGPSPRGGGQHAVVGFNGKVIHDPHPDNQGLSDGAWTHGVLVKVWPRN